MGSALARFMAAMEYCVPYIFMMGFPNDPAIQDTLDLNKKIAKELKSSSRKKDLPHIRERLLSIGKYSVKPIQAKEIYVDMADEFK